MGYRKLFILFPLILSLLQGVSADPFPDAVTEFIPGVGAGFGQENYPDIVLGPPRGGGEMAGGIHVLSLGDGGSITLEFVDNVVTNGPGPDLIIFENPFFAGGNPEHIFSEVAFVEVSADGQTFHRFVNDYDPLGTPINNPLNWFGFAGVNPCLSHPDNEIDPTDPLVSGGDLFDLEDLGLDQIRYVRLIDTDEGENAAMDDGGDEIYDPGMPGEPNAGFDLDAIAAVYSVDLFTPTPTASATPAATATITPSPTPTANTDFQFKLTLTATHFVQGDPFRLDTEIVNPGDRLSDITQYLLLDVYGMYFFHPGWTEEPDFVVLDIDPGVTLSTILEFIWPDVLGHAQGLYIWGGLVNQEYSILGSVSFVEFSY